MIMTDLVEQDNYHVLGNNSNKWEWWFSEGK